MAMLDRVRARANMPKLEVNHLEATQTKEAFLERLQMERSLELCLEGHRWADLKRWGLLKSQEDVNKLAQRDPDFDNFIVGRHECLPIPSSEVNNNENLDQNPNY
ncbi:RagB/SusD family nutrient uptake outer membrane protein [Thermophagus sp. OGC60D27]|uniref:RagB/SusD family nutrient uptake outer membrane protein n=1 Tax=Thermophagus sp. OGC60D27 TaxID=3458415 RepID=UPI004037D6F8